MFNRIKRKFKNNQRGSSLAMLACSMAALMFAGGVVLDLGSLYANKSHLQNVADSAALAGVSQFGGTQFDTVSYRLSELPSDIDKKDGSFTVTLDGKEYHLFPDDDTALADRGAEIYVDNNTSENQKISLTALKKKDEETTKLWASRDANNNVNSVCYLVRLQDTIPTYFARFFGIESLTPEATAVAMAYIETSDKNIDDFIPEVAKNIAETIPNYYWESIVGNYFTVTNTDPETMNFNIRTTDFGYRKSAYFTDSWDGYIEDITKEEDFTDRNSRIIAYKDRDPVPSFANFDISITYETANANDKKDNRRYWLDVKKGGNYFNRIGSWLQWGSRANDKQKYPVLSVPGTIYKDYPSVGTYTIYHYNYETNKYTSSDECIMYDESADATLLDSICAEPIYADESVSSTTLAELKNLVYTLNSTLIKTKGNDGEITGLFLDRPNIGASKKVRGTVLNITSEELSNNNSIPLYMRFESEPIKFGGSPTFAQPITINVKGYQKKPMIIAYDGPDPNRTMKDVPKTDVKNPASAWAHSTERILSTERLTSATLSAPYTINLDADFNGVIYAPFSEVTITGSGKINGFVMAARIIDKGTSSTRTRLTSGEVSLPIWGATHEGGNKFSYTVKYIKDRYSIVYDSLTYYTNSIVYKEP